jgi:hypothetical protein
MSASGHSPLKHFAISIWQNITMLSDIVPWKSLAMYAPILTATIAIVAAGVAWRSIRVQRSIARKRAAVDVFIKTEMDQSMIDAYEAFRQGRTSLSNVSDEQMGEFSKSPQYRAIRAYLDRVPLRGVAAASS